MAERYVGLISGTSTDGVDAVLVDLHGRSPRLLKALNHPYPEPLRARLESLITPGWQGTLKEIGHLHAALGAAFAEAATRLLEAAAVDPGSVRAIGSHGQTVCHAPQGAEAFSLQLGDPSRIAATTGITTVADFRSKDIALGGEGAPLVPAFHAATLQSPEENRVILNLGGIANLSLLPAGTTGPTGGFDTGPANTLMDGWIHRHREQTYDRDGAWAASGAVHPALLDSMLSDPYFATRPPKSTGREHFNATWLDRHLAKQAAIAPVDVQATLLELTARSITDAIAVAETRPARVIACGGGTHNRALMERLAALLAPIPLETSGDHGIPADWMEAMAFAWLARQTLHHAPGNVPEVTGARHPAILGAIHPAD